MNIVVVGIDDNKVKQLAVELADLLQFPFIDATTCFNEVLLTDIYSPLANSNKALINKESLLVCKLSKLNETVIFMPNDMFLSSKNYLKFNASEKICVEFNTKNDLLNRIQQTIKSKCNRTFALNKDNLNTFAKILL